MYTWHGSLDPQKIINARHNFILDYCKQKGWKMEDLSFEQILEIRKQDEWKNPILDTKE